MLIFSPSSMSCSTASMPSGVPGTLIITLGRPTTACMRRASATIWFTSPACASNET
jgi:hypothetical protein